MSGLPPDPARVPGSFTRAVTIAAVVTVVYGAILVAAYGLISLIGDRDVIDEPDAGPLVGPMMSLAVVVVMFFFVLGAMKPAPGRSKPVLPLGRAVITALCVYLGGPAIGGALYALGRDQALSGILFFAHYLGSPFVICSAIVSFVAILLMPAVAPRPAGPGRSVVP